jgi:gas vesicle protein
MTQTMIPKASYFLVGLGIGTVIGILFATRSGEETREYLAQKAREGSEYTQGKARELRKVAENIVQRGKEVVTEKQEQIATAIQAGREAYQKEVSKTARRPNGGLA